jgi:hypothetical protein
MALTATEMAIARNACALMGFNWTDVSHIVESITKDSICSPQKHFTSEKPAVKQSPPQRATQPVDDIESVSDSDSERDSDSDGEEELVAFQVEYMMSTYRVVPDYEGELVVLYMVVNKDGSQDHVIDPTLTAHLDENNVYVITQKK